MNNRRLPLVLLVLVSTAGSFPARGRPDPADQPDRTARPEIIDAGRNSEEYRIGKMVKEIAAALKAPEDPKSLETIVRHGHDSRYYVMIRGWLVQELKGVESQLGATRDNEALKKKHQARQKLLKTAIRRIDLE